MAPIPSRSVYRLQRPESPDCSGRRPAGRGSARPIPMSLLLLREIWRHASALTPADDTGVATLPNFNWSANRAALAHKPMRGCRPAQPLKKQQQMLDNASDKRKTVHFDAAYYFAGQSFSFFGWEGRMISF